MMKGNARRVFLFLMSFIATLFFVVAVAVVVLGFVISGSDVIFPNVSAEGIDLSGMTVVEARERLVNFGYENNADFVSVTINFPDGSGFSVSGKEAGFSFCAEEAAAAAFRHGRDGSFFERVYAYVNALLVHTNMNGTPVLNEEFVREEIAIHTKKFNDSLVEKASYYVNEDSITIVPGSGFAPAEEESVFNFVSQMLYDALEEGTRLISVYTTELTDTNILDADDIFYAVHTKPVSAEWDSVRFAVTESVAGIGIDVEAAEILLANAGRGEEIIIPFVFTEPEVSSEYLKEKLFRDELANRTTRVSGTAARFSNVQLAASFIDGLVLNPGDVFSFNETVPRRTTEAGFRMAGGFRDGELVDMVGGGICQVASSLYDNVLHAHLEVVQRRAHTLPVTYLPLGQDASIYYGVLDLKFKNDTNYPIRIEIEFDERDMTTRFIGTRTNDHVIRIESNRTAVPFETVYREDANVPSGEERVFFAGQNGAVAITYRIISDAEGNQISRTRIARDVYRAQNRVVLIPASEQVTPS